MTSACPWMIHWANIDCNNDFPNKSKSTSQYKYGYACFSGARLGTKVYNIMLCVGHSELTKG